MDKKEYIRRLAKFLVSNKMTMTGKSLADHLNWNDFRTNNGDKHRGGRGTYTIIDATYKWLVSIGEQVDADNIALAFKKPDGTYAYDKG